MISDNPVYQEAYYRDGRTSETERLDVQVYRPVAGHDYTLYLIGALLVGLGWYTRGLFAIAYDYHLLMLITVVACYIVASRR